MDKLKKKRTELAKKLSGKYDDVEEFEAAGGSTEDLPGSVSTGDMKVASSPVGGESFSESVDSRLRKIDQAEENADMTDKRFSEDLNPYGLEAFRSVKTQKRGDIYRKLLELEQQGAMKLSDEFRSAAEKALRKTEESLKFMKERGMYPKVLDNQDTVQAQDDVDSEYKSLRDLQDLSKDVYELTPFARRAREFRRANPNKPYRESGGE